MKLIHHLSAHPFPRCEPEEALPSLLAWAGVDTVDSIAGELALLRRIQNG
jgi:hypothetical protein